MAIIDVVKWDGTSDVLAYKYPETNLTTFTQLIVNESQEAVLFHKGKLLKKFGSGKHTLSTENIPVLENLFGIPFGGKNPFTAEVWFVNKVISLDVKWGTPSPLQLRDPEFGVIVPVRAFGQFGIQVGEAEKFLVKLVGTLYTFDRTNLSEYFKGILLAKASTTIARKIVTDKISVLDITTQLMPISENLHQEVKTEFEEFGLNLVNFFVSSINIPEDDSSVTHLKSLLSKKAEMNVLGYTYQQARSFDVLEGAAQNEGTSGSIMGAGMGMGMGFGMGGAVGGMMNQIYSQVQNGTNTGNCNGNPNQAPQPAVKTIFCDKCKKEIPSDSKFCPHCGDVYVRCPKCGADIPEGAIHCPACGAEMPINCPKCNNPVRSDMKFCPNCGNTMTQTCGKCGCSITGGFKFCPSCGEKTN